MTHSITTSPDSRRNRILDLLKKHGECSIDMLADEFGVSGMTIRRDLQELCDSNKAIRTHGGAAPAARISFEFRFLERSQQNASEKRKIAEIATALIQPGDSVLLDSSTTTLQIAKHLKHIQDLRVITTSLPIASELFGLDNIDVIIIGGQLRKDSPDLIGAITDNNLDLLRADIAFIGVDAIDLQGNLYNNSPDLGRMLKRMSSAALRVYAVADHSKIDRTSLMRFGNLRDWQGLITDSLLDKNATKRLESTGVKILQAQ
ncbi:DeoR/GlpR family DNA-binding transcription regulator [Poriferisphaera sp. WC338]|uniref:DeoR/GlpR family DNA-binding transcription regulator n=1 Tax=Poriferisphaera sp. WC338 TaxID=3425129 RepID=UPI003D817167